MNYKIIIFALLIIQFSVSAAFSETVSETTDETVVKTSKMAGQWPFLHPTKAIAVDNDRNLVFMGDGEQISILDTDLNLMTLFPVTESGQIGGIFYTQNTHLLYIACKKDGLRIVDVSDPETPVTAGAYIYPDNNTIEINGVFVKDQIAYLACGLGGMEDVLILDVSTTSTPFLLKAVDLPVAALINFTYSVDIFVSGNYAWVADPINGIHAIDITQPDQAAGVKLLILPGARDLMIADDYLYTAIEGTGIGIIDITDPLTPKEAGTYVYNGGEAAIRTTSNFVYVAYPATGFRVLDITDKTNPIDNPSWVYSESGVTGISLGADENSLFITSEQTGMHKIDITDKANMQTIASYDTPADAVSIDVSGSYIYAVDHTVGNAPEKEGLRIFLITPAPDPNDLIPFLSFKGFCATPGTANDIKVDEDFAYVADGIQGLQIISLGDKSHLTITGSCEIPGNSVRIDVKDHYAYICGEEQGLSIIDITDKSAPWIVSSLDTQGNAGDIDISGEYAYIANGAGGMLIVNISEKSNPTITAAIASPGIAEGISVFGNHAYMAIGDQGMAVFDISSQLTPTLIASFDTPGYADKISVSGEYAFIADGENGLCTINISTPDQPVKDDDWSYNTMGITSDVYSGFSTNTEEAFIFVADGPSGVVAINLAIDDNEGQVAGSGGGGCFIQALGK